MDERDVPRSSLDIFAGQRAAADVIAGGETSADRHAGAAGGTVAADRLLKSQSERRQPGKVHMSEQVGVQPTNFQTDTPTGQGGDASIREKAEQSAQAGKEAAGQVAQTAVSRAQDVAQEAQAQARNVVGEARDQLRGQVSEQHQNAVRNLRTLAEELHSMAANGQRDGLAAGVVGQAADRAQDAASWLETRQPGDVLEEVRRFARRRPGAFLFGALAAGVVAGRLTRGAVAAHSQQQQQPSGSLSSEAPPAPVATASATTQVGSTAAIGGAATGEPARHAYGAGPSWGDPTLNEGAGTSGQLP